MAARKQTSNRVSSIAGKYVGDSTPFTPDIEAAVASAIRSCGVPLNDRAVLVITNKIETALEPLFDDVRSLAASCLSQDEVKGKGSSGGDNGGGSDQQGGSASA